MLACPNCSRRLGLRRTPHGLMHVCGRCGGRMVATAVLRKEPAASCFLNGCWQLAREAPKNVGRPCPICRNPMRAIDVAFQQRDAPPADVGGGACGDSQRVDRVELDVCMSCACIWFDSGEYGEVPRAGEAARPAQAVRAREPRPVRMKGLREGRAGPVAAVARQAHDREPERELDLGGERELAAALGELESEAWKRKLADEATSRGPDARWKYLPAIFGFPVECGMEAPSRHPWVTWGASALCVIVFAFSVAMGAAFFNGMGATWGFVPNQWLRMWGLTLITGFFIHGGLWHLLGNVYFLAVLGDNVEDNLGRGRYVWLLLAAHLAGYAVHGLLDGRPGLPLVGASAGISGVIAYYALAFPRAKLGFLFFFVKWFHLPAWGAFILWVLLQALIASQQARGITNVSGLAHLGGAGVGFVAALALRRRRRAQGSDVSAPVRPRQEHQGHAYARSPGTARRPGRGRGSDDEAS